MNAALGLMNLQFYPKSGGGGGDGSATNTATAATNAATTTFDTQNYQYQLQQQQVQKDTVLNLSRQPQVLDSRVQSGPNATSTPNPIQQQTASTTLNQDILTNLFFKFDPNLFQKKDQLNLILNNGQTQPQLIINQPHMNQQQQQTKIILNPIITQDPKKTLTFTTVPNQQQFVQIANKQPQQPQQNLYVIQQQIYPQQQQQQQQQQSQQQQQQPQVQQKDLLNESTSSDEQSGEKPYKCSQCFKLFRKKVHLNQHVRIHSGERPYGCDFCEKRFTQLSHLWQHTRRHTGERPYKCDIGACDKTFTQLSNLQSHIRTHGQAAAASSSYVNLVNNSNTFTGVNTQQQQQQQQQTQTSQQQQQQQQQQQPTQQKMSKKSRNSNKKHYCEFCHKRFATEGVIRQHQCTRQPSALLERTSEGGLILKSKH